MEHPWAHDYKTYLILVVVCSLFWIFVRYLKVKWEREHHLVLYSDIQDIELCRMRANTIETEIAFFENVEVNVFGQGIFIRYPGQNAPLIRFRAETMDEVHRGEGEIKIASKHPHTLVDWLIVRSECEEDLEKLARSAETLVRLSKRRRKKPERLLKRKI